MRSALREPNFQTASSPGLYTGIAAVMEYNGLVFNDRRRPDMIRVTKITGLDDPDIRDSREENPDRDGETPFDALYGGQTITIQGEIISGNFNKLEAMWGNLKDAFDELTEKPLKFRWLDWNDGFVDTNALVDYTIDVGAGGLVVAPDRSGLQPQNLSNKQFWVAPMKYAYGDSEDVVGLSQVVPTAQYGPILRRTSANQFLYAKHEPANGRVALYKRVGGTDTLLDSVSVSLPTVPLGNLVANGDAESGLTGWAATVPTRTNLITNPSFENASAGTAGWTSGVMYTNAATLSRVTSSGIAAGSAAMQIVCPATQYSGAEFAYSGGITTGQTFTLSVYVSAPSATTTVQLALGNAGDVALSGAVVLSPTLTRRTVTWTSSGNYATIYAAVRITTATATTFVVDAAQLTQTSAALPYFDGDTPGYGWNGVPHASTSSNTATVTNLMPKPRFEDNASTGWAAGNTFYTNAGATLTTPTTGGSAISGGTRSMQVTTTAAIGVQGAYYILTGIYKAGATYVVTVRVKGAAGGEDIRVRFGDQAGTDFGTAAQAATTAWQEYRVAWTPTADRTNPQVTVWNNPTSVVTFYVDAVGVFASANNAGYFDGTFPGASWTGTAYASTSTRSAAGVANLVYNGNFESGVTNWSVTNGGYWSAAQSSAQAKFGTKSILATAVGAAAGEGLRCSSTGFAPLVAGQTYTFSAWVFTPVANRGVTFEYNGASGWNSGSRTNLTQNVWTFASWTVTLPSGSTPLNFFDLTFSTSTGAAVTIGDTFYVDGVTITPGSSVPIYFDGNTTGAWWMGAQGNNASVLPALTQSSDWATTGSKSFRMVGTPLAGETPAITGPTFSVTGNAQYAARISYNARALSGAGVTAQVLWSDGSTSSLGALSTGTGTATATATAPGAATTGAVRLIANGIAGVIDVNFDSVIAVAGTTIPLTTFYVSARADGATITYGMWSTVPDDFGTPLAAKTFTLSSSDQATFPSSGTNTHGAFWTPGDTTDRLVFYDIAALNPGDAQINCRKFAKIESDDAYEDGQYKRTFMLSLRSSSGRVVSRKYKVISLVPTAYALTFPADGSGLTFPADGSGLIFGGQLGTPVNLGRAPAGVIIRMYGPMPNPAVANQTNGTLLGINGTIADGDYYEFNTLDRTVVDSAGTDQYDKLTDDTNWLVLDKGPNNLLVGADSVGGNSLIKLFFQHSSR